MDIITKDTGIIDAVQQHPEILEVFAKYGLGCVGCMAAHYETIGQGAGAHGIDVEALIWPGPIPNQRACLACLAKSIALN